MADRSGPGALSGAWIALTLAAMSCDPQGEPRELGIPAEVLAPAWLSEQADAQIAAVEQTAVRADLKFVDRRLESGIKFRHVCLPDSGKDWRAVHYDHGNSVSVADVDGDGLLDLYFTNQAGRNELWHNLGGGRFEDWTDLAGVALGDRISVAASFADADNDGDADLYVTAVRAPNVYFENQGHGRFRDATGEAGLSHDGHSSAAQFFDYDRDGWLDLFLVVVGVYTYDDEVEEIGGVVVHRGRKDAFGGHLRPQHTERSKLFRNVGNGRFEDVTERVGLVSDAWSGDASPVDFDADGWIDLYVLNMQGHDEYWENRGGTTFVERGREVFGKTPWGSMGIKAFDMDNDGDQDVFLTDMHSDMSIDVDVPFEKEKSNMVWPESFLQTRGQSIFGNALFRNDGGMEFTEVSDAMGAENYWPWGLSSGDLNADGFEDAFVASSMNYPFRYCVNRVLLNDRGRRFIDAEFALGIEPRRDGRTARPWFELECSGADREHKRCEGLTGKIMVWAALGSRSSAIFDLDADGDLDVVTNDFNAEPMVLISDLASRRPAPHWLAVRLRGTRSNRSGFGASVGVSAGPSRFVKVHDGKSGYLAQSDQPLYFGLGERDEIDRIAVAWPSGTIQTLDGPIAADRTLVIEEPAH